MPQIIDDKSPHVIPFLLSLLDSHKKLHPTNTPPFFIGLNGVQGAGKTVLVILPNHLFPIPLVN